VDGVQGAKDGTVGANLGVVDGIVGAVIVFVSEFVYRDAGVQAR